MALGLRVDEDVIERERANRSDEERRCDCKEHEGNGHWSMETWTCGPEESSKTFSQEVTIRVSAGARGSSRRLGGVNACRGHPRSSPVADRGGPGSGKTAGKSRGWARNCAVQIITKAGEKKDLRRENHALKEVMARRDGMSHIVGDSPEIVDVVSMVARVAASDSPVLINGESGTGKELVARTVHFKSRRASRPFVSVNCGALPDTLLETEPFGHKPRAFSGAVNSRVGLFEAADGGTLFLDEIGEMSPAMQVRLLRVLDSGEVRRVGEERAVNVDARIVAATNKDLNREATEGRFRWDLFYRVATIVIPVPALRRRRDDIPLLVQHFSAQGARGGQPLRFSADAMERLQRYEWPGNIRELRNLIERLQILHDGDEVQANALPAELTVVKRTAAEPAQTALVSLQEMERQYVERVLQSTAWNKAQAARVLEVDIKTLNKKIRDFNIVRPA